MANRRMFSKAIIESARFLKMPSTSRLLYYDLCMRADDDGVVEAFTVIRTTGAAEDDLRLLVTKGYVKILDPEDLIAFIVDWKEHNKIRPDRKIDSIYKNLLVQVIPGVSLLEAQPRADTKKKTGESKIKSNVDQWTSNGQPMDGIGEDRLGQDRIVKDKIGQESIEKVSLSDEFCSYVVKLGFTLDSELGQAISNDIKEFGLKEVKNALSIAASKGKNYSYAKAILNNRKAEGKIKKGIKTFEDTRDSFLKNANELIEDDYNF